MMRRNLIVVSATAALAVGTQLAGAQAPFPVPPELRGDPIRGEQIYQLRGCPTCHGASGTGGQLGPDLTRPWPQRDFGWYQSYL
ncbi:MAG: hypothetical protein ACE5G5_09130, partial [Candidatus Methylomirabilales bacterium]